LPKPMSWSSIAPSFSCTIQRYRNLTPSIW
jgi:hypothetical protein